MKKIFLIFITMAVFATGCDHNDVYQTKKVDYDNIAPFAEYKVPVEKGKVSIVMYGKDTLAITGIPMTINIPKEALKSKTKSMNELKVSYSNESKFEGYKERGEIRNSYTLFFEDTRNGDDDYNDLIIRVKKIENIPGNSNENVTCGFVIHPVAMGAMKNFKLGFEAVEAGKEYIVVEDCREKLFGGQKGYINTVANTKPITTFQAKTTPLYNWKFTTWNGTHINWFIETDTERMYIALSDGVVNQNNIELFGNKQGRPYGIAFPWGGEDNYDIFTSGGPFYATECTPIQQVYGNFEDWIRGDWKNALSTGGGKGINNADPQICYNASVPH